MAQTIKLKRSSTSGAVPTTSQLELGEVAINTYDGKMYIKKNDGSDSVVEIGGGSAGNDYVDSLSFATGTGVLTAGRTGSLTDLTVDLDGRYLELSGGTLTGALQAQPWLFRSMDTQVEYHVLDNGNLNGPSWKFRYDGATANRYVDFGYKDGNGNYSSGLKLYNNQIISWRGTDIINASAQWTGGIASSGYNSSNWDTAYGWGNHASAGYLTSFDITTQTDPKYLRSDTADSASGHITFSDSGYSIGNEYHTWKRAYVVNQGNPDELLYRDGNSLPNGGAYRFHAHIDGTGTDQSATAVYWNQNGTWKLNVTYQSGTSSNHPEFIIDGGVPKISIDHTSNYTVQVLGERIELSEGTGTDNKSGFGTDAYLSVNDTTLRFNPSGAGGINTGNLIWHQGNDGSGSGLDADTVDGIQASSFLRSDADDEKTGHLKLRNNAWLWTQYSSAHDEVRINANTSGGLDVYNQTDSAFANIQAGSFQISGTGTITGTTFNNWNTAYGWGNHATAGYLTGNQTITLSGDVSGSGTTSINVTVADDSHNHVISNVDGLQSALDAKLASSSYTASDVLTKIKTVDGSGSGLDADTVDGIQGSSFLRSDTSDTWSGDISTTSTNGIRFGSANQTDGNDGFITAGRFGSGLNIVGTQTTSGTGRQVRIWGSVITNGGDAYWHSGNDGSGSGLDADTVDGIQASSFLQKSGGTLTGTLTTAGNIVTPSNTGFSTSGDWVKHQTAHGYIQFGPANSSHAHIYTDRSNFYFNKTLLYANGYLMWHAGNDGSGSGLDADTLDGIQASGFARRDTTGVNADYGHWYSTSAYVYDSTNGMRYYWILLGTMSGSAYGSIEYEAKDDHNYPHFVKGTIGFGAWNGGASFSVQHDQQTADFFGVQVRVDTSRRIWLRVPNCDWSHFLRFRVHNANGFTQNTSWSTGSTRYETAVPNSSNDVLSGQNLRATSSSVTGAVPTYSTKHYFGRIYARSNIEVAGSTVWHAGNDGSGSGLDADLLDGLQGSSYLKYNSYGRVDLGFVTKTVEGGLKLWGGTISSGVDTNVVAPLVLDRGDYIYSDDGNYLRKIIGHTTGGTIEVGQTGTSLISQINLIPGTAGNSAVKVNGNTVWNAANDGSGSGLDADTVDGVHESTFMRKSANSQLDMNQNDIVDGNSIYMDNWYRSTGSTGWYSQTYGGGIYMSDSTWVKTYNSKKFYVGGGSAEIATTGNVTAYYSDERLKTKTGSLDNALEKVKSLEGFTYVENELAKELGYNSDKQQVGVSAQQVQAVLPEAVSLAPCDYETLEDGEVVSKSGEDYLTVDYSRLVPLLIESIKELKAEVDDLKTQLEKK